MGEGMSYSIYSHTSFTAWQMAGFWLVTYKIKIAGWDAAQELRIRLGTPS